MFRRLMILFFIVPIVELSLIFLLAHWIGWGFTLLVTLLSSVIGAYLARRSWHRWWDQVKREWAFEGFPVHRLGEGAILVAAMAFLVTPGPLTAVTGILFTIPKVREAGSKWLVRWLSHRVVERWWWRS
ncbi:FxsA cytoplasmic membrane protein [Sulfobacillus acidophilus DSM 10332]|uniref:FxsA cytoplasmic membrane protein n=1 Tax=Sulfobacillus acidophilus (strain ATCC 700253 / DSM 10332 / NAL) TaxID=679936 RepID=G8U1L0_SULAD|nr:FxsA cytoplasmic membrane protein [Sulfobacillus acidophilus DSM 10332]